MGKASKFKKFRREAAELPLMNIKVPVGSPFSPKKGEKKTINVNHHKQMKYAYVRKGMIGVEAYKNAVKQSHQSAQPQSQ